MADGPRRSPPPFFVCSEFVYDYYWMADAPSVAGGAGGAGGRVATVDIDLDELWDDNVILVGDENDWLPGDDG